MNLLFVDLYLMMCRGNNCSIFFFNPNIINLNQSSQTKVKINFSWKLYWCFIEKMENGKTLHIKKIKKIKNKYNQLGLAKYEKISNFHLNSPKWKIFMFFLFVFPNEKKKKCSNWSSTVQKILWNINPRRNSFCQLHSHQLPWKDGTPRDQHQKKKRRMTSK